MAAARKTTARKTAPKTPAEPKPDRVADTMQVLASKFAAMIRDGIANPASWRKSWASIAAGAPHNVATKYTYTAGNRLYLTLVAAERGWGNDWSTFQGWLDLGAQVRKGEKAQAFILVPIPVGTDEQRKARLAAGQRVGMIFRAKAVFNAAQVDGYTPAEVATSDVPASPVAQRVMDLYATAGASSRFVDGDGAYYSPAQDRITLPTLASFKTVEGFASTALHELTHWTGHESRLARDIVNVFGTPAYAREELTAELGAAALCNLLGVEVEPSLNHAHYLASWLQAVQDDPRALWTAASKSEKAVKFLTATEEVDEATAAA